MFYEFKFNQQHKSSFLLGEISGSHGGKYEDDCLVGCCAE
jgi:hypothetical protein